MVNEKQYLQEPQKATFLCKQTGTNLKIVHMIHTNDKTYRVHEGIGAFVEENCPDFIFVHRSYAVNSDWIKTVTPSEVILINGERMSISR